MVGSTSDTKKPIAVQISDLFARLRPSDLDGLSETERHNLARLCRRWADLADRPDPPKSGVLSMLVGGRQA